MLEFAACAPDSLRLLTGGSCCKVGLSPVLGTLGCIARLCPGDAVAANVGCCARSAAGLSSDTCHVRR